MEYRPCFVLCPALASFALLLPGTPAAAQESAPPVPAAPDPVAPEPAAPDPVTPEPAPPDPVAPEPAAPALAAPDPPLPAPSPPVDAAPPALAAPEPAPGPTPEPPPPDDLGPLKIGVWGRVDLTLNDGEDLDDIASSGVVELHTSGKLHEYFAFTANFVAAYGGSAGISGDVGLEDLIVQFEPSDMFHVWLGRNLVPVDRSNFSGTWFMAPWFFPGFGFVDGQVGAPREGPNGRNDGVTAWGFFADGLIKYYVGAYDLYDRAQSPLISGRLNLSFINGEPGFYSNSTYYGKNILALGGGVQYKKNGSTVLAVPGDPASLLRDDYSELNADVLFETKLGDAVLDLEGAYYKFNGDYEPTDAAWFGLASVLLPGGAVQPLVRVQQAIPADDTADTSTLWDAQIGYVLNAFATRLAAGFRYGKAGELESKTIFLGAQFLK